LLTSAQYLLQAYFAANAAALSSRRSSPRVTNEEVQKAVSNFGFKTAFTNMLTYHVLFLTIYFLQASAVKTSDHRRATTVSARLDAQQKKLNLPILPTTTIGSFPQTVELRRVRREYKAKK
jgi:5-methyltetrahydropteroyltriglutamate--homocysteine methyltransferase